MYPPNASPPRKWPKKWASLGDEGGKKNPWRRPVFLGGWHLHQQKHIDHSTRAAGKATPIDKWYSVQSEIFPPKKRLKDVNLGKPVISFKIIQSTKRVHDFVFFLQHHISLEGSPALKKITQNFSGKKNLTNSPRTSKTPPLPRHQLLCSLWYSPIQKRPKATEASWHPEFRAKSHGSTPLKTKMTGWKILIFNKKYIFIHGRCSSQVNLRGISTKRHQLQLCLV